MRNDETILSILETIGALSVIRPGSSVAALLVAALKCSGEKSLMAKWSDGELLEILRSYKDSLPGPPKSNA